MARIIQGEVISRPGNMSIIVTVKQAKMHPIYKKRFTRTSKYMAHDKNNEASVGDKVEIIEVKPISARKRFALNKILAKATTVYQAEDALAGVEKETTGEKEEVEDQPTQEKK